MSDQLENRLILIRINYPCDACSCGECTVKTTGVINNNDTVTCDACNTYGYIVFNGLQQEDGSDAFDIVWIDSETGEDYRW